MALTDTFTGSGTLEAHASDSGHSWDQLTHGGSARTMTLSGGVVYLDAAVLVSGYALASWVPSSADYDVTATVMFTADAGWGAVLGRATGTNQDTDLDGYMLLLNSDNSLTLYRFDNGALTSLGTFATAVTVGNSYDILLRFSGTTIKGFLAGTERISVTDATYSAAGSAGIGLAQPGGAGAATGAIASVGANDPPATAYTVTGPASGVVGSESSDFTATANGYLAVQRVVTITVPGGVTSVPSVTLPAGDPVGQTFTYTPDSAGDFTISFADNGSLADPAPLTYTAYVGVVQSVVAEFRGGAVGAVGFRADRIDGTPLLLRSTAGVTDLGDDTYSAAVPLPNDFHGKVYLDDTVRTRVAVVDYTGGG